ncbi:GNAT family N-acetyltransferase [Marinifilum caeruleilacunae]|uniref:GNAT family N-acetyltransferase n=1 Tax=Marinifilum caeruleilacunae TaxID=2499076 RepID=A0ABX1WVQ4_9BACT|nr:GNAT family N-acetyltransferase [Marinifilum caeruleilacunae]NOU60205.1 GNAT family N-acetyltransferase [Marinifilum caeruleilacunae]
MKIESSIHTNKSGKKITLRKANSSDAHSLRKCILSYINGVTIPFTRKEFEKSDAEIELWINELNNSQNSLLLIAEYEGEIIGNIDVSSSGRSMLKHTGYIGMGVHEDWQNCGVGSLLFQKMIDYYERNREIEMLWLQVFGTNLAGLHMYHKFGFEEKGRQEKFIKMHDGKYIDNVIMTKTLI